MVMKLATALFLGRQNSGPHTSLASRDGLSREPNGIRRGTHCQINVCLVGELALCLRLPQWVQPFMDLAT